MEYFNYLGSMEINYGRFTLEIQYIIAMAEQLSTRIKLYLPANRNLTKGKNQ
jgi:hypothetical protein